MGFHGFRVLPHTFHMEVRLHLNDRDRNVSHIGAAGGGDLGAGPGNMVTQTGGCVPSMRAPAVLSCRNRVLR